MPKDREELHQLTVAVLRELAKKRLGPGTAKLRNKAQLIEALERGTIEAAPPRVRGKKAAGTTRPTPRDPIRSPPRKSGRKSTTTHSRAAATASAAAPDSQERVTAPEPLLALPLDARTLLVRWKQSPLRGSGERWELEVFSDGQPARTIQVAPQSRQAHVRSLVPGTVYRAQLVARAPSGRSRVIGSLSRPVVFFGEPAGEPESVPAGERFVRYDWSEPARSALGVDQPAPGLPLPGEGELAALGMAAASRFGLVTTSPGDSAFGYHPPTSFAN